jgi:hypothetical protein
MAITTRFFTKQVYADLTATYISLICLVTIMVNTAKSMYEMLFLDLLQIESIMSFIGLLQSEQLMPFCLEAARHVFYRFAVIQKDSGRFTGFYFLESLLGLDEIRGTTDSA